MHAACAPGSAACVLAVLMDKHGVILSNQVKGIRFETCRHQYETSPTVRRAAASA